MKIILAAIMAVFATSAIAQPVCPEGYRPYKGPHCFKLVSTTLYWYNSANNWYGQMHQGNRVKKFVTNGLSAESVVIH